MCGIFGFFSKRRVISTGELSLSMDALRHRGPDNTGVAVFSNNTCASFTGDALPEGAWASVFAHTRLSIIDLTDSANQPMSNEDGSIWIVYNGEIYNFMEIKKDLESRGHRFQSRSDTETIIHGYEEWGIDVLQRLRGMFAFALFDRKKNKLLLVRDRLGVKPLKYYHDGNTIIFSSELKGFLHLIPRKLNLDSVNTFLTLKYIPSPETILEGVRKLSPGELLEFDLTAGRVKSQQYWEPKLYPKTDISFGEAREEYAKLLSESVFLRTVSDVPIGVYLSGGIDSSAIVTFLRQNGVSDIRTFTIKFERRGYDESRYARIVSDLFKTDHHEFQVPVLTGEELHTIIASLDEPFGDPSYIPTYYLSKYTSQHVKVILSGDGGDELLGSYKRYFIHARGDMLRFLPRIRFNPLKMLPPEINKKRFFGRLQRIAEQLSLGYWNAYFLRFNGFDDSLKRSVMVPDCYQRMKAMTIDNLIDISHGFTNISDTKERLIWIDLRTYLPDYILTKTDLALMAHSVEGRNPFVDYRLAEFSNMLPPEYKFRDGGKYILKNILSEYLPKEIVHRKKMGFSPPIKYWFRENTELLDSVFSKEDFVSTDIFDLKHIHKVIEKYRTTSLNISEQLWLLMVFELWRRTYNV
jgi:asparagine synthase (glutamine-hydrolysing)